MITHAFPPFGGGGVQRMIKFSALLPAYNWKASVVCPGVNDDSWLDYAQLDPVKDVEQIRTGYRNLKNDPIMKKIIRRFLPTDVYFNWAQQVVRLLMKKDLSKYEVILTSGPPHSVHHVGMILSKKRKMKWVADFRDHFTLGPEYRAGKIKTSIDNAFEKKILLKSNAVIVNTATNKNEILKKFHDVAANKIHVIYNGFDYNDLKKGKTQPNWPSDKKNYLYLGGLRGDKIDGIFYATVKKSVEKNPQLRDEIKIHIVGDHSRKGNLINEFQIADMFEFEDAIAFNEVADYLEKADGCLTWQRPESKYKGTIAGKVFDYIGMRKPIFSIGQDEGEIAKIIVPNNIGVSANPGDIEKASEKFQEFHDKIGSAEFDYASLKDSFFDQYNRVNQVQDLVKIFNSII